MVSDIERHESAAQHSHDQARRDRRGAWIAAITIGTGALVAHEVLDRALPNTAFGEAASNVILEIGGIVAGTTLVAGNISASRWRKDERIHSEAAEELRSKEQE